MTATLITFPNRLPAPYSGWLLTLYRSHFARDRQGVPIAGEVITADSHTEVLKAYAEPQWLDSPVKPRSPKEVKDSSSCVTPALMAAGQARSHAAAGLARVLFVDFDGNAGAGVTFEERDELLSCLHDLGRAFVVHTTSSTPFLPLGRVKLRLVMPLLEPVEPEAYTRLWAVVADHVRRTTGLEADSTKTHPGDLFYRPVFHRDDADRWGSWIGESESLLWDMPVAATESVGPYERLRNAVNKNDVLFRVAYGMGRRAAAAGDGLDLASEEAWAELRRGLEDNRVSAAVKDWAAAESTARRKFAAGWNDEQRESGLRAVEYRAVLIAELRDLTAPQKLTSLSGRVSKALSDTITRVGSLIAAELGMPADELQGLKERVLRALGGKAALVAAYDAGLGSPVDPEAESRARERRAAEIRAWSDLGLVLDVRGRPSASASNVIRVFNGDPALQGLFLRNCRSELDEVVAQRDFRGVKAGDAVDLRNSQTGYSWFASYLGERWSIRDLPIEEYNRAVEQLHGELPLVDPVVSYFDRLATEASPCGVERLETFFVRNGGAVDSPVVRAMTRSLFLSTVRAAYEPGVKTNLMWVLIGDQGIGKTQVLHTLVCDERYFGTIESDEIAGGMSSDSGRKPRQTAARSMLVEVPEIHLQGKAVTLWKSFISDFTPAVRLPYSRAPRVLARRSCLVATSNVPQILKDSSGNRRFLIIELSSQIDLKAVREERDSLWAEAVRLYRLAPEESGVPEELWSELAGMQEAHRAVSGLEEQLEALTTGRESWPLADTGNQGSYKSSIGLRSEWLPVADESGNGGDTPKVLSLHQLMSILRTSQSGPLVAALTKLGWKYRQARTFFSDRTVARMWVHPKWSKQES